MSTPESGKTHDINSNLDPRLQFNTAEVNAYIERERSRRQSNKVLHGHPSPMHWKELPTPTTTLLERRSQYLEQADFEVNLYVGTPFCIKTKPAHCGFCLFPSEDYQGNDGVERYLSYLKREFDLYKPFYSNDKLASIYFGGGTPNLYHADHYPLLMQYVDELYRGIPDNIEISLEGIPQLFNESKIKAIKSAGFNRVSIGVQQMNDKLIKYSGRRQKREQIFTSIELCDKYDLACSVDLIFGWPEQSMQDMLNDLKAVVDTGIHHLTHYELNVAGRSDFSSRQKRALLPSIDTNIEMYKTANQFLRAHGFEQVTVYDWERKPADGANPKLGRYDYEHNMHHFVEQSNGVIEKTRQVCGIGFAAVNFHPNGTSPTEQSWIYMNHTSLTDYYAKLDNGQFPTSRGFMYNHHDVKLAWLFQSMQTMCINYIHYQEIFNENLLDAYSAVWTNLEKRDWISISDNKLNFQNEGQYYIPMLQSLIASKRLQEIRSSRKQTISSIQVVAETVE